MFRSLFVSFMFLGVVFVGGSCSEDEGVLSPDDSFIPCRFDFPQGESVVDQEIAEIQKQVGCYVIYKEITTNDLNRSWNSMEYPYQGELIEASDVAAYVSFLKDNLFDYVDARYLQLSLPVYIYCLKDLSSESWSGRQDVRLMTNGADFWALGLGVDEMNGLGKDEVGVLRNRLVYSALKGLVLKGVVEEPVAFSAGIDYKTEVSTSPSDRNYYLKRGFVDMVDEEDFESVARVSRISYVNSNHADFLSYVRIALFYSETEFLERYPIVDFPLLYKRYQVVVSHLLESFNIDLKAIEEGK